MDNEDLKPRGCRDCGSRMQGCGNRHRSFNVGYMLNDDLWTEIIDNENGSDEGLLCIICAQLRLGRKLVPADFAPAPLNLRERGILSMLFPDQYLDHMRDFVRDPDA